MENKDINPEQINDLKLGYHNQFIRESLSFYFSSIPPKHHCSYHSEICRKKNISQQKDKLQNK